MLHLLCGKIAAGKSTLARELASAPGAVLIAEDEWLSRLFPGQLQSLADYVAYSARLKEVMGPHVVGLLRAGVTVVMDFPANTVKQRAWLKGLFVSAGVKHQLHWLEVSDDECRARLRARNASGAHAYVVSDAQFDEFTKHFMAPGPDEGFDVVVVSG